MKKFYSRIEFWIIILFLIRLIGITNPPLEISHNWRQVTGLMVSRNFLETDANILYPRVDDHNGTSGIIGMEFPSLNYLHFLMSKYFGYAHWFGRLINLIVTSFGLFFFYKLLCLARFRRRVSFFATILLGTSVWFSFARKMMPDTYCISLMIIGLYFGLKYLNERRLMQIFLYIVFCTLAVLSKIPAGIYLVVPFLFLFDKTFERRSKIVLSISTLVPLIATYFWYFRWNLKLSEDSGMWYNAGKPIQTGFTEIMQNLGKVLDNFYFDAFSGFIVFGIFAAGCFLMFYKKDRRLIIAFLSLFAIFVIYIFKSGFYFYHHNYYIIPFVPVMALVAGYALSLINRKWIALTVLLLGVVEGIANQQHDFFIKPSEEYKMSLEQVMNNVSAREDLILLNGNGNPQMVYLSHHKGWNCTNEQLSDTSFINDVISKNCRFIVIDKHSDIEISKCKLPDNIVFDNDDFLIIGVGK
jgi:hypothetical protein